MASCLQMQIQVDNMLFEPFQVQNLQLMKIDGRPALTNINVELHQWSQRQQLKNQALLGGSWVQYVMVASVDKP